MSDTRLTLAQIEARASQHEDAVALLAADEMLAANGYAYIGAPCACPDGGETGHRLTCGYGDPDPSPPTIAGFAYQRGELPGVPYTCDHGVSLHDRCAKCSVPPFPAEPAFGSPEAVEVAAQALQGFTPGPWKVRQQPDDPHPEPGIMAGKYYVATCHDMDEQTHANARLIAAAPDLLAEVERLRQRDDEMRPIVAGLHLEIEVRKRGADAAAAEIATLKEQVNALSHKLSSQRDALADALEAAIRAHYGRTAQEMRERGHTEMTTGGPGNWTWKALKALRKAGR